MYVDGAVAPDAHVDEIARLHRGIERARIVEMRAELGARPRYCVSTADVLRDAIVFGLRCGPRSALPDEPFRERRRARCATRRFRCACRGHPWAALARQPSTALDFIRVDQFIGEGCVSFRNVAQLLCALRRIIVRVEARLRFAQTVVHDCRKSTAIDF